MASERHLFQYTPTIKKVSAPLDRGRAFHSFIFFFKKHWVEAACCLKACPLDILAPLHSSKEANPLGVPLWSLQVVLSSKKANPIAWSSLPTNQCTNGDRSSHPAFGGINGASSYAAVGDRPGCTTKNPYSTGSSMPRAMVAFPLMRCQARGTCPPNSARESQTCREVFYVASIGWGVNTSSFTPSTSQSTTHKRSWSGQKL